MHARSCTLALAHPLLHTHFFLHTHLPNLKVQGSCDPTAHIPRSRVRPLPSCTLTHLPPPFTRLPIARQRIKGTRHPHCTSFAHPLCTLIPHLQLIFPTPSLHTHVLASLPLHTPPQQHFCTLAFNPGVTHLRARPPRTPPFAHLSSTPRFARSFLCPLLAHPFHACALPPCSALSRCPPPICTPLFAHSPPFTSLERGPFYTPLCTPPSLSPLRPHLFTPVAHSPFAHPSSTLPSHHAQHTISALPPPALTPFAHSPLAHSSHRPRTLTPLRAPP